MQAQECTWMDTPFVIERGEIPSSHEGHQGIETRSFLAHDRLGAAVASSAAQLAWVQLQPGEESKLRAHPVPSLLVVLYGTARLVGDESAELEPGDVVTLPANQEYGFSAVGANGFRVLQTVFTGRPDGGAQRELSLKHLLDRNETRARAALDWPFFRLLSDGSLESPVKRKRFRDALRIFSDAFQSLLFARQATCRDPEFYASFHEHLMEEIGHNRMLESPEDPQVRNDRILQATGDWFSHRMLTLDNADKAIVALVLETAGYHFHGLAEKAFAGQEGAEYFHAHAEADEHHKDAGLELLEGLHPDVYRRLIALLEESWEMLEAALGRIAELVHLAQINEADAGGKIHA